MNVLLSIGFVVLFILDYYFMYKTVSKKEGLTEKQRAHILSIKATVTLFLLSSYFNYKLISNNFDIDAYTQSLTKSDGFLVQLGVLNLIAYLITDCYVGYKKYHKYMCILSGYPHHIIYVFVSMLSFKLGAESFYFLFMIEELPTFFLSVGNYNKRFRWDNLFGLTFFLSRIVYHGYLVWKFSYNKFFMILGFLTFILHSYWFKNWFTKYFLKKTNKKDAIKKDD
jgi:hypothetical protein